MTTVKSFRRQSLRRHFTDAGTGAGRQTDFLTLIFVFHFLSLRLSFIIAGARRGRAVLHDKFDWPCQDNHFDSETFLAKPDLHRQAIQRGRAFDRQRDIYWSWGFGTLVILSLPEMTGSRLCK
jgi:hypothetical protein